MSQKNENAARFEKRRATIESCFAHARQIGDIAHRLQRPSLCVRLPFMKTMKDEELAALELELRRKAFEAKQAEITRASDLKRGIRPVRRAPKPAPQHDPVLDRVRAARIAHAAAQRTAVQALSGLNLVTPEAEAAE